VDHPLRTLKSTGAVMATASGTNNVGTSDDAVGPLDSNNKKKDIKKPACVVMKKNGGPSYNILNDAVAIDTMENGKCFETKTKCFEYGDFDQTSHEKRH
jgi:hypothetical protein